MTGGRRWAPSSLVWSHAQQHRSVLLAAQSRYVLDDVVIFHNQAGYREHGMRRG